MKTEIIAQFSTRTQILCKENLTWPEIRRKGVELAKKMQEPVRCEVWNETYHRWEFISTNKANGWTINLWGDILKLRPDARGYEVIHRKK